MRVLTMFSSCAFMLVVSAQAAIAFSGEHSVPVMKLEFGAVPEKQKYHVGEIVRFVFSLHNSGDQDVLVARHFVLNERPIHFTLVAPTGCVSRVVNKTSRVPFEKLLGKTRGTRCYHFPIRLPAPWPRNWASARRRGEGAYAPFNNRPQWLSD